LSKQEKIPEDQWCYETNAKGQVAKLKENYLSLTGYRLPTEAEWEYACRAGALTSRCYGETAELLGYYGWYFANSPERTQAVGSKKPNDWGLFDMHGNVWNWCQESYQSYPKKKPGETTDDIEDMLNIIPTTGRVLRGGSFRNHLSNVHSALRYGKVPSVRVDPGGFRASRTLPLDGFTALPLIPPEARGK
jgi:eukaryotic-like serine/threonine-protein kinase